MNAVVFFIQQIAPGLYILIAVAMFLSWRSWSRARQGIRSTYFELERDIFRYRQANASTSLILLVELGLIVLGIQQVVAPTLSAEVRASEVVVAVDAPFRTPTPAPVDFNNSPIDVSGVQIGTQEGPIIQLTATPSPTPVGTILPNPPPVQGCDTANAVLQIPANGMLVFEPIPVVGSAFTDDFSFYRFEISGPSTNGNFVVLGDYSLPVDALSALGQFTPVFYLPGEYEFRLTVFNNLNELKAACTVNITVSRPIPTNTPLPTQSGAGSS